MASDVDKAKKALEEAPVLEFALQGLKGITDLIAQVGDIKLQMRAGGGRWPRGVASVYNEKQSKGWAAVLETPFMGMEWGGYVTNVYGMQFGTDRRVAAGFESMWAPWHGDYAQGYIIGSTWTEMSDGEATRAEADAVLAGYTAAFDKVGLKRK